MHLESSTVESLERERILARARLPLPERAASQASGALAWARVSKSVQDSIEDQLAEIRRDAKVHGVTVTRERYATGRRWNHKSEDWRAVQADLESGEFAYLWLFKADRLAGDDQEMVGFVRRALKMGIQVRDTIVGKIDDNNVGLLGLMSYMDIKNTSERTMLRLDAKPEQGVKVGGVPYGYEPQCRLHPCKCGLHGRPKPDPKRKPHILELFESVAAGVPLEQCRKRFNAVSGLRLADGSMKRLLRNEYYAGVLVGRKTHNSVTLGRYGRPKEEWAVSRHEYPMIEQSTFDLVQARLDSQAGVGRPRQVHPSDPLVGLIWCTRCNRRMRRHRASDVSYSWQCPLCHAARGQKRVQAGLHDVLSTIPFPSERAAQQYAQRADGYRSEVAARVKAIDARLDRIAQLRSGWADLVGGGDMPREDYRAKIAETDAERLALRQEREALAGRLEDTPGHSAVARAVLERLAQLGNWTNALGRLDDAALRRVYVELLARLKLDPDQHTLTVQYTDALARWCGRTQDTVALPSQKAR